MIRCAKGTPLILRLEFHSMPVPECGCQIWLGHCHHKGYGQVNVDGTPMAAHRASWVAHVGPIPDGMDVLHWCDTPPCIRPDHLFLGTDADNNADMMAKGRNRFVTFVGEANGNAKLDAVRAHAIRKASGTLDAIAASFGIARSTVHQIRSGKTWRQTL